MIFEFELKNEKEKLEDDLKALERIAQKVRGILSKRIDYIDKELEKHILEQ